MSKPQESAHDLERIRTPEQPPPDTDLLAKQEAAYYDNAKRKEELEDLTQDRGERKRYAKKIYYLVLGWLTTIMCIVLLQRAMGASTPTAINRRGAGNLPVLLTAANLKPFIDPELEEPATTRWYKCPVASCR